ncbi:MAG TPA: hypothetical protein VIR01_08810, partial [Pyrinomonadaceae bacterium]
MQSAAAFLKHFFAPFAPFAREKPVLLMTQPEITYGHADFSLVRGGLLFQLYRRTRLSGDALELARRRVIV